MSLAFGLAIYFVLWWITLLAVLPFGVRSPTESGERVAQGHDPGAPVAPRFARKFLWTTGISALLFALIWLNERYAWLTFAMLPGPDSVY
jgi:predicted secreted protein